MPGPAAVAGRWAERIAVAEQGLRDSEQSAIAIGADPDRVEQVFAIARDWLAEAIACADLARRAWALASFAQDEADKMLRSTAAESGDSKPDPPAMHNLTTWPKPAQPKSAAEYVGTLRMYHVYAGEPSYREMSRRIGNRFAPSTLHNALHKDKLPRREVVHAIISACEGSAEHHEAYAEAWRFLAMARAQGEPRPDGRGHRTRSLYSINESA